MDIGLSLPLDHPSAPAPSKPKPRIPQRTKQAVIAAYAVNGSIQTTANTFNIHRNTVRRILCSVRNDARTGLDTAQWKTRIEPKAWKAVEAGLECGDDPYRQANVGSTVLSGLGIFKGGTEINVGFQVNACPPELLERLIETPEDDNPNL